MLFQMTDRVEVVVSRYNENLAWTLYPPFNQFRYTVYNKGPMRTLRRVGLIRLLRSPMWGTSAIPI